MFITFEGMDGSGKTTQATMLKEYLDKKGVKNILVREPGSTMVGEKLRQIVLTDKENIIDPITEVYIFASSRSQLVREVIKPSLKDNIVVICDRFVQSSLVYQGVARGLSEQTVSDINKIAINGLEPDVTFFIDIPAEVSVSRKKGTELDRIEIEQAGFQNLVYNGYQEIAKKSNFTKIDGTGKVEDIHMQIIKHVDQLLNN